MPDVHEVDDVAEARAVDEVAERAAEEQAEADRHERARPRPRGATRTTRCRR